MFNVYSGGFSDVFPGQNGQWRYSPNFTSLALADLTGSKQDVIFMLRDPVDAGKTGLLQVNPANVPVPGHEIVLETGYYSWKQVRAGDVNGDGRDDIVILRVIVFEYTHGFGRTKTTPTSLDLIASNLPAPIGR